MPLTERVCIVGAGPCGMLTLCAFKELSDRGKDVQVSCYDKQSSTGGVWNYNWRTGTDEFGEPVHGSMYRDLFTNTPKECIEFPDYTFLQHFGKQIPSYPPREVFLDYLRGYWRFRGVSDSEVKLEHCVRNVVYDDEKAVFRVRVDDLRRVTTTEEEFDYLIVAVGRFYAPVLPDFPGIEKFLGRVLHSHDLRNSREFKGQDVLVVGGSFSASDIAMQCVKFGANSVTISYRTKSIIMDFKFPPSVTQHPEVTNIRGKTVYFKDDHFADFDSIILCTGYQLKFPFLPGELTLKCRNVISPPNLYRMIQWVDETDTTKGRLLYLGMPDIPITLPLLRIQGLWASSLIKGLLVDDKSLQEKKEDILMAAEEGRKVSDLMEAAQFEIRYLQSLCEELGCPDFADVSEPFKEMLDGKNEDMLTYRDKGHFSLFDKTTSRAPAPHLPWLKVEDDSMESFLGEKRGE